MAARIRVPLRQHEDGRARRGRAAVRAGAVPETAGSRRCCSRGAASRARSETSAAIAVGATAPPACTSFVGGGVKNASVSAITCDTQSPRTPPAGRLGRRSVRRNPVEAPFERADHAIGGDRREPPLPGVEEGLKHSPSMLYSSVRRSKGLSSTCRSHVLHSDTRKWTGRKRVTRVGGVVLDR